MFVVFVFVVGFGFTLGYFLVFLFCFLLFLCVFVVVTLHFVVYAPACFVLHLTGFVFGVDG